MIGSVPTPKVRRVVDPVAEDDLHGRCHPDSTGEIGDLAKHVNVMGDRLQESELNTREGERKHRGIAENAIDGVSN